MALILASCFMEGGGSSHSLVIKVLVMSHKERVGDRMRQREEREIGEQS